MTKPLRHCTPSDLFRHPDAGLVRRSQAQRLYSVGLLEEAYKLSKEVGLTKAAKTAGVKLSSLRHYAVIRRQEEGIKPTKIPRSLISNAQKKKCHEVYSLLMLKGFSESKRKCWIEAGKRTGVNGRSVEFQYVRGLWKP